MQALEKCWKSEDGDLPFNPNVSAEVVLAHLQHVTLDQEVKTRVRQWMRFHHASSRDAGEKCPSYRRIQVLLDDTAQMSVWSPEPAHWRFHNT